MKIYRALPEPHVIIVKGDEPDTWLIAEVSVKVLGRARKKGDKQIAVENGLTFSNLGSVRNYLAEKSSEAKQEGEEAEESRKTRSLRSA